VIRDYKLVVIVNLLLVIDLVILSTWQMVDPPFRIVKELLPQVGGLRYCNAVGLTSILDRGQFLPGRRYASATRVLAVLLCLFVCVSVRHMLVSCRNGCMSPPVDRSSNPTTCLIPRPIRPTVPHRIYIRSAVLSQCTGQTERQAHTDQQMEAVFDDYRPLSL